MVDKKENNDLVDVDKILSYLEQHMGLAWSFDEKTGMFVTTRPVGKTEEESYKTCLKYEKILGFERDSEDATSYLFERDRTDRTKMCIFIGDIAYAG